MINSQRGRNLSGRRIIGPIRGPNQHGIYQARVEVWDPGTKRWVTKAGPSTLFPNNWTPAQIEAAIQRAFANRTFTQGQPSSNQAFKFGGDSGHGFEIWGYFDNGVITTAYPVFVP